MSLVTYDLLQEEIDLTPNAVTMVSLNEVMTEIFATVGVIDFSIIANSKAEDGFGVNDGLIILSHQYALLSETVDLFLDLLTDEVSYITLALDTERLAPSVHNMIRFNSFALINDVLYAAGAMGIYKIIGNTDDGRVFTSGVSWNKTSFGKIHKKKIRAIYLEGEANGAVLQAKTNSKTENYTTVKNRIPVSRNLKGSTWDLRFAGFERLEAMDFVFIMGRK